MSLTAKYMIWYYEADIVHEIAGELMETIDFSIMLACQTAGIGKKLNY